MSVILGIDPGTEKTGWAIYSDMSDDLRGSGVWNNEDIVKELARDKSVFDGQYFEYCACEWMESRGMPVGQTTFETIFWIGRFYQEMEHTRVTRKEVQIHLCGSTKAKDSNVRRAILDRFPATGGGATPEVGIKKQPGPLYGISSHAYSALAVAITFAETKL